MLPPVLVGCLLLAPADSVRLVVVATTDVHGRATAWDYEADRPAPYGLTRVATVVDSLRAAHPGRVLVVDAGDLIQGNPFATYFATVAPANPNPVLEAMNVIGYDVATPGNHEFNFGVAVMQRSLAGARFPYVSANIRTLPERRPLYAPYVLLERGGVRVGVTGLTTPGVMVWDRAQVVDRVVVEPLERRAGEVLGTLRSGGADLMLVVAHAALGAYQSYDPRGVGRENGIEFLARLPVRPDLVVFGHSHGELVDTVIGGVHFVQPRAWARSVTVTHVHLVRRSARWQVAGIQGELVSLRETTPAAHLAALLEPAHERVRAWVAEPLGTATAPMPALHARIEDTPIIDFVNEVQRESANAQLAATAAFNTGAGFAAGPVRLRDLAALYPYENTLKAVRLSGDGLRAYLEQSARYFRTYPFAGPPVDDSIPGFDFDIVTGVEYVIDLTRAPGGRIRSLTFEGRAVTAADTFTLALNSYRQGGGGGFVMLRDAVVVHDNGESIRGLLADAVRRRSVLRPEDFFVANWRIEPEEAVAVLRAHFARGNGRRRRRSSHVPVGNAA